MYLFDNRITDYSVYMISDELKALIILYFNYKRINLKKNNERNGKYLLINPELIKAYKNHYNYDYLEKILSENKFVKDIIKKMESGFNDFHEVLDDKNISVIIKNYIWDINKNFKQKGILNINNIK